MENLQVSILVPIYGVEKYIRRCAISLMEQTYDNIEYVFVNDCTKDKSVAILKEVISEYPEREDNVKIINLPQNLGLANARNVAVENSNGDFVIIVDSDDWVELDMVESLVKEQRKENADIVSSNTYNHNNKVTIGDTYQSLQPDPLINIIEKKASFNIWGRLIKKNLYTDNNIRCKIGVNQGEDLQTFPKLAYFAKKTCVCK